MAKKPLDLLIERCQALPARTKCCCLGLPSAATIHQASLNSSLNFNLSKNAWKRRFKGFG